MVHGRLNIIVNKTSILMVSVSLIFMVKAGLIRQAARIDRAKSAA